MKTFPIIKLSWKNIWRNPVRSSIVIISVILAIWSSVFLMAFFNGMTAQFVRDQLGNFTSHVQIHDPDFVDEPMASYKIKDLTGVIDVIDRSPFIVSYTTRSIVHGLASSATNNYGVKINGVDPGSEIKITRIHTYITEGEYLPDEIRNPVLIGEELAKRLSIQLRGRLILTFQDIHGEITAGAFRVSGIYRTPNSAFNESNVIVRSEDLNRLLGDSDMVHEVAILVDDFNRADVYVAGLDSLTGYQYTIRPWGDLSPSLRYVDSSMDMSMYIIMIIIIVALCFGVINTMLMAVLERTQELGMLRAVGLNKRRTFTMIMSETFFLTMIGAPVGMALSWVFIEWFGRIGIDLGAFSKGMELYGFESVIYTELHISYFINITIIMLFATIISATYPALKVLKLNPVEAIRKL